MIKAILLFIFFSTSCTLTDDDPIIYIGILEYISEPKVRIVFFKDSTGLHSMKKQYLYNKREKDLKKPPPKIDWNIYFDGKTLGMVSANYKNAGLMEIIGETSNLPRIKIKNDGFYWVWTGRNKYRPLVLSSKAGITDPDGWKLVKLDKTKSDEYKDHFVKRLKGDVFNCTPYEKGKEQKQKPSSVSRENVNIVKSYKSKNNILLYAVKVNIKYECDGILPDDYSVHWFYVIKENPVFLGINFSPLDAGDFDGDGKSEWIFQYDGYNENGYSLFFDNFKKKIEFNWGYH